MTWLDRILAALALAGFIGFIGIVGWLVKEPDLILVFLAGGLLAAWDFWNSFRRRADNDRPRG